jgi:uncharacterized protein
MEIEFDPAKDAINQAKHGLSLADVAQVDWGRAIVLPDTRFDYQETRFRAYGFIGRRLHMMAYTMRGTTIGPISFRKANRMEVKRYGKI